MMAPAREDSEESGGGKPAARSRAPAATKAATSERAAASEAAGLRAATAEASALPTFAPGKDMEAPGSREASEAGGQDSAAADAKERAEAAAEATKAAVKKYSIVVMKMSGGFVKFLFEDCLQFFIQGSYLVKFYHDMSKSARYFTMASMTSSLIVSFAGPVSECCKARAMMSRGQSLKNITDEADPEMDDALNEASLESQLDQKKVAARGSPKSAGKAASSSSSDIKPPIRKAKPRLVLSQADPESFLRGDPKKGMREHAIFGNRALLLSAVMFWAGMAGIPFIFKDKLTCGANIPMSAIMYFFGLATFCTFCELYVMVHIEDGVRFIMFFVERLRGCHNIMFTLSPMLSYVARFDTFSDIIFTVLLMQCPPIHWISIKGYVIQIPYFELGTWAVWTLVIGVVFLQVLPGLFMLSCKIYLPMGLKLNEFNTLLALIDEGLEEVQQVSDQSLEYQALEMS